MNQSAVVSTISDVERDTGLAKDTLRVWERRYAFPQPLRNASGERIYPAEQVFKLRLVKRLIDLGFRPGKVIHQSNAELQALSAPYAARLNARTPTPHPALQRCMTLCQNHQMEALRDTLLQALQASNVKDFVIDLVAPLAGLIGQAWASGKLAIFEEHLCTEILHMILRNAIFGLSHQLAHSARPRILLTTLPQERHGLGLLMAEALCVVEGAYCMSMGVQTPLPDIVAAARSQQADIVALSFSNAMNARQAVDGLNTLRLLLPGSSQIWAGGNCAGLKKNPPEFVQILGLQNIGTVIGQWREQQRTA